MVLGALFTLAGDEVVKGNGLGTDVALLKVRVNHTRSLRSGVAHMDGPGAHFLHASGEVGLQPQQFVGCHDQAIEARLVLAEFCQEHGLVFILHVGHFGLHLGANSDHGCVLKRRVGVQAIQVRVVFKTIFRHVGNKHRRFGGDQKELREQWQLFFGKIKRAHGLGFIQCSLAFFQNGDQLDRLLVTRARGLRDTVQGFFNGGQIGQTQFGLNHLDV